MGNTTAVVDQVTAQLSDKWFWKAVGANMWIGLPILFAYRGWRTQRLLEGKHIATPREAPTAIP